MKNKRYTDQAHEKYEKFAWSMAMEQYNNNYRRNHGLSSKRYCGYHKRRDRQRAYENIKRLSENMKKVNEQSSSWSSYYYYY